MVKNPSVAQVTCRRLRFNSWLAKGPSRRKWQPAPVFLPGNPHGQRSLMSYSPCMTEQLNHHHHLSVITTRPIAVLRHSLVSLQSKVTSPLPKFSTPFFVLLFHSPSFKSYGEISEGMNSITPSLCFPQYIILP